MPKSIYQYRWTGRTPPAAFSGTISSVPDSQIEEAKREIEALKNEKAGTPREK